MQFTSRDLFVFTSIAALVFANVGLIVHARKALDQVESFRLEREIRLICENEDLRADLVKYEEFIEIQRTQILGLLNDR
jgi:hypothetical protein